MINETGTLKEDFGDNLGLKAAFSAYQSLSSTEKKKNLIPELKEFTDQQLFFLAFGQVRQIFNNCPFSPKLFFKRKHLDKKSSK